MVDLGARGSSSACELFRAVKEKPKEYREAARVILVDPRGYTLLFRGGDPDTPGDDYWFTPGGGLEPGESLQQAARREVLEEVGVSLRELGSPVLREEIVFPFMGKSVHQKQVFFLVHLDSSEVSVTGWNELERRTVRAYRWWAMDEIQNSQERIYPPNLVSLMKGTVSSSS